MTYRTARRYAKTGGRGYGAEPQRPTAPMTLQAQPPSRPPTGTRPPGILQAQPPSHPPTGTVPPGVIQAQPPFHPPTGTRPPGILYTEPPPLPTLEFIPRGSTDVFHPPGPGIGLRPGPAPALGRPGDLPGNHGSWKNESCFSPGSRGWKPDILTLGDAHACPGNKGPQSPFRPPNISQGAGGYNDRMFHDENNVAQSLNYIGYSSPDGNAMIREFQRHWNGVISPIAADPHLFSAITFAILPEGNLRVDGEIGPHTLNALEVAVINQRTADLPWPEIVRITSSSDNGYGRHREYNAAQGM